MDRIRKGDDIIVLAGKDKGKRGVVQRRLDEDYVLVDGINIAKKHVKPNPVKGIQGGIADKNMPIHQSNVAIFNPKTQKADRVGTKTVDNKKVRVFKSNGELIDAK